jgi:hypothetical protein
MLTTLRYRATCFALLLAVRAEAQTATHISFSTVVRVSLQIDSASTAEFTARNFDLRVARDDASASATSEIQLVKRAGVHTGSLVRLSASGLHAASGVIDVLDSLGHPALTLRLSDVVIVSDHLTLSSARANLEQQRIVQQEALSALTMEYQEAQRELATAEELNKTQGMSRMDLARARDRASDLQRRIDLQKQRQTLLASQQMDQGPVDETVSLRFNKMEIESHEPGGSGTITVGSRPPKG